MSQNNRYMAVGISEEKRDVKKVNKGGQGRSVNPSDASVAALERELAIYKRDSGIEMEELRAKVNNIPKGGGGEPGKDGVGIESVEQTVVSEESGGENKVEITLTDGQKTEVVIRNGKDGKDGEGGGGGGNVTPESIGAVPIIATYITSANTQFNLDTATDSFYIIQSSLIPNCPISGQYVFVRQLFFKDATATSSRTQIMYPYGYPNSVMPTNGLAIRVYCNGVWSAWKNFATTDQIPTTAADIGAIDAFVGWINGTDIKFDTAFTQGEYQVVSNNETSDTPPYALNGAYAYGKLIVIVSNGGTYNGVSDWLWQIYYPTSGGAPYIRSKINNGAFSSWQRIATTDKIPTTAADVGAVRKSGDTMTGQLTVPLLRVSDFYQPIEIGKYIDMHNPDSPNDDFSVRLIADGDTLKMQRKGVGAYDTFYHTGNKPTDADVGALKRGTYERIQGTAAAHKNLNDYVLPGFYNVKTAYVDNCPSGIGVDAVLLVYPWDNNIYNMQEITETAASPMCRRWTRHSNAGTWTAWKAVITEDSKSLITPTDIGAFGQHGTLNWEGTDLNDFKSFEAIIVTSEKANKPANAGPYATVWNISGVASGYMIQNYLEVVGMKHYYRGFIDGAWKDWKQIATTDYIDEQILKGEW